MDFGHALLFYFFLIGATMVLGVVLLMTLGFKVSALGSELVLYLALPFFLSRILDTGWNNWTRWPKLGLGVWVSLLLILAGLAVLLSNIPIAVDYFYPMSEEYRAFFEQYLRADSAGELIVLLLVAAIVPGICEEVAFRGLIQGGVRYTYGPTIGVIVTSVLFALIHLSVWNFFALLVMGLFLSTIREMTGSIWPGAVAHALNNGAALALITFAPPADNQWQYEFVPLWLNGIAAIVLMMGIIWFMRQMRANKQNEREFETGLAA